MSFTLSNAHLHFTLDEATSTWSLFTQTNETPSIEGARFNGYFRFGDWAYPHLGGLRPWQWRGWLDGGDIFYRTRDSAHGELKLISARLKSGMEALGLTVEFALPKDHPFLMITLRVQNFGDQPLRVSRLQPLFAGPLHHTGMVRLALQETAHTFFSNGWQSWSYAGTLTAKQHQPHTQLVGMQSPLNHNPFTPTSDMRGQFSSDMFGVLAAPQARSAIVAGFLSQREQFGSMDVVIDALNPSLRLRAQCDDVVVPPQGELTTDAAYVQLLAKYEADPLRDYTEAVARENRARVPTQTPVGWCSWYHYFDRVTENDIRANLQQLEKDRAQLPLTLFQIDDGFERNVGDWEANEKFPSGMGTLAKEIQDRHFTAGVWLAPFIAKPDSKLAHEHPEWFIGSDIPGLKANAGFVFNKFCQGLDTTHPGVQDFTRTLISRAVKEWGYPYLKLDFLYAAALKGKRHDVTVTRAQALHKGLSLIREAAGAETFILGCGCPLGTAVGLVDAMRISADVAPTWRPKYLGLSFPFKDEAGMPAARNAIRNTLTRQPLHRRWWLNDPDCLLVREATQLKLAEVQALASVIALSGGMFLVSDEMTTLSAERRAIIEKVLPIESGSWNLEVGDWLEREMPERLELHLTGAVGAWQVVGLFNWGERAVTKQFMVEEESHVWDFWNQTYARVGAGAATAVALAPHSGKLLGVRRVSPYPQYVGSSLHFAQGLEISAWAGTEKGVRFVVNLDRVANGEIWLALPPNTRYQKVTGDIYSIPINLNLKQEIKLEW